MNLPLSLVSFKADCAIALPDDSHYFKDDMHEIILDEERALIFVTNRRTGVSAFAPVSNVRYASLKVESKPAAKKAV